MGRLAALINYLLQPESVQKTLIGVAGAVAFKLLMVIYGSVTDLIFRAKFFTISGTWCAEFESHATGKPKIEFVRFVQAKERVRFTLQQYSEANDKPKKFCGDGILRWISFSAVYYAADTKNLQSGAFILTLTQPASGNAELHGTYAELKPNQIEQANTKYILKRLNMSLVERLKLAWGFACFKDWAAAQEATKRK
ncbi:MAG TPA: hypothetical protein VLX44_11225 [Xanthobacteraceae bacterium]|nr:hypothetical protein [Xanthobacteraceae bacterium]